MIYVALHSLKYVHNEDITKC